MNPHQKFQRGDVVHIAKDLGSWMRHFTSDVDAVILGSYYDQFGGDPTGSPNGVSYTVLFFDGNECSWYSEYQLTFIRHDMQAIDKIKADLEARKIEQLRPEWILEHWKELRESTPGYVACFLMSLVGITEPWGSQGEGLAYYANWQQTFKIVDPVLSTGDIEQFSVMVRHYETRPVSTIDVRIGG